MRFARTRNEKRGWRRCRVSKVVVEDVAVDAVVDMIVVVEAGEVMMGVVEAEVDMMVDGVGMMLDAVVMMLVVEVEEGMMEDAVAAGATETKIVVTIIVALTEVLGFLLADLALRLLLPGLPLSSVAKESYHPARAAQEPSVALDHRDKS
jgi:hypothetical protein